MIKNTIFTLKLFFWHACIILCWVFLQVDMQKLIKNECIQKQLAYRTHSCKQPLVWEPTPLSTVPLSLGFEDHIRHYILYISLVALIAKVFLHGRKLAQRGLRTPPVNSPWYRTHSCKQPLVWEPTPLSIEPLWLGLEDHIRHYILYISLVALIAKVFLHGRKLAQRGRRTPPVNFPWYGNPPPYPLSHSGLALRIIFAIIFSIFETFLEIIETRTGFDEFESKWKHFGKHLSWETSLGTESQLGTSHSFVRSLDLSIYLFI